MGYCYSRTYYLRKALDQILPETPYHPFRTPFKAAVPCWGQTTQIQGSVSPKRDFSPKSSFGMGNKRPSRPGKIERRKAIANLCTNSTPLKVPLFVGIFQVGDYRVNAYQIYTTRERTNSLSRIFLRWPSRRTTRVQTPRDASNMENARRIIFYIFQNMEKFSSRFFLIFSTIWRRPRRDLVVFCKIRKSPRGDFFITFQNRGKSSSRCFDIFHNMDGGPRRGILRIFHNVEGGSRRYIFSKADIVLVCARFLVEKISLERCPKVFYYHACFSR